MDAAMQRMTEILERVHHEPPNTAAAIPVDNTEIEKVTTDSGLLKAAEFASEVDTSLAVVQDENMDQTDQGVKRQMEGTSVELSSDPFLVKWPWISVVFTSSWGQWLFGSDEQ